ncbi:hypothetical protein CPC16_001795 [Podila verticillata]|nr:hypothetical protein CPC16_001795 [Podila verticillata]
MPIYSNPDILGADFLRLVNSPVGSDVRLIVGEEKVVMHAHSLILQARSTYFTRALSSDWKEASQGVIHKPNIRPAVFERVLQYIYGGRLMLDDAIVMDLIKAADELCMEDLLHGCERHALTTICRDNVLDLVHLASQHNLSQLKAECLDFIASNIDHLKKGKPILTLDADILKDILSMDQLDLEEIEIWKIAVRWAYYQQGLDWAQCPVLDFPRGSGCVLIQTFTDEEPSGYHIGDDGDEDDYDELDDARVPLGGTNIHISGLGDDEDGFRPPAQSVFQRATSHNIVKMSATVHEDLRRQLAPVLSAIRFMRIPSLEFLRLIEGTGLLPVHLCAKVYRYHSVPSMADPYQTSLRRRMAFSTVLNKDQKEVVLEWLQMSIVDSQTNATSSSSTTSSWHRRSYVYSPPMGNASPASNGSYYFPATTAIPSVGSSSMSPPGFSSRPNAPSPSPSLSRLAPPVVTTPNGQRPSRSSSSLSAAQPLLTLSQRDSSLPLRSLSLSHQQHQQEQTPTHAVQSQLPLPKLTLQYRATRDGFDAGNFHMACDQRGPTLTVVRADNGAVFGGYNSSSWSSHPSGVYSTSKTNFLFTLKSREHPTRENMRFDVKGDGNAAAYNKADFGPTFGVGHDLYLASNCNLTCQSSSTMPSSYNGPGASTAALAGSYYFRVSEVEVFLVQSASAASP